jgi:hypothetical protein
MAVENGFNKNQNSIPEVGLCVCTVARRATLTFATFLVVGEAMVMASIDLLTQLVLACILAAGDILRD